MLGVNVLQFHIVLLTLVYFYFCDKLVLGAFLGATSFLFCTHGATTDDIIVVIITSTIVMILWEATATGPLIGLTTSYECE